MPFVEQSVATAYRSAWEAWIKQVEHVHRVFLESEPLGPAQIKGLLNREARAKETYDAARLELLGIEDNTGAIANAGGNPFR
jgi:hypothetical protein